jgi:GDP-L-fucose synthase
MIDLKSKKVILTGGAGFLGSYVEKELKKQGCKDVFIPIKEEYDLRYLENVKRM